LGLQRYIIY